MSFDSKRKSGKTRKAKEPWMHKTVEKRKIKEESEETEEKMEIRPETHLDLCLSTSARDHPTSQAWPLVETAGLRSG